MTSQMKRLTFLPLCTGCGEDRLLQVGLGNMGYNSKTEWWMVLFALAEYLPENLMEKLLLQPNAKYSLVVYTYDCKTEDEGSLQVLEFKSLEEKTARVIELSKENAQGVQDAAPPLDYEKLLAAFKKQER
ncbi:MAG TPA: hypothetical protein VEA59_05915 [Patescibacteria group bacterium]|nr:hypothetical protein [Patescibacteria group bacterium]